MVTPAQPTRRLGELLVQRGLLTRAQLEVGLRRQQMTKEFLGAILVDMKLITPDILLKTLSEQFQLPYESLSVDRVDWRVAKQFPASAFASGQCFPIRADAESVTVAIVNPLDAWALSAFQDAAGFRTIKPVLVLASELQRVLQAYRQRALEAIEGQLRDTP